MINFLLAAGKAAEGGNNATANKIIPMVMLGVLMVAMVLLSIIPQRKRSKKHKEMMSGLKAGTKIKTIGGLVGEIKGFDDTTNSIVVDIARDKDVELLITLDRGSIYQVLNPEEAQELSKSKKLKEEPKEAQEKEDVVLTDDEIEARKKEEEKNKKKEEKRKKKEEKEKAKEEKELEKKEETVENTAENTDTKEE